MDLRPPPGREETVERLIDAFAPAGPALVIVRGHRGSGKSALLRHLGDVACHRRHPVITPEAAGGPPGVPYAPMAHLLPEEAEGLVAHRDAVDALSSASSGPRTVVTIDDADRLDEATAAAVAASIRSSGTLHVRAMRAATGVPSPIDDLLTSPTVDVLELHPLDRDTIRSVVEAHLGAPISEDAADAFNEFSAGDPFALSEAIQGALEEGLFVRSLTAWGLSGPLRPSTRLLELTSTAVAAHAGPERQVIDRIAIGGALPLDVVVAFSDSRTVAGLEASGEVIVETGMVRLGPALNAASVGELCGAAQRRVIAESLVPMLDEVPPTGWTRSGWSSCTAPPGRRSPRVITAPSSSSGRRSGAPAPSRRPSASSPKPSTPPSATRTGRRSPLPSRPCSSTTPASPNGRRTS